MARFCCLRTTVASAGRRSPVPDDERQVDSSAAGVEALAEVARACSPRVELWGADALVFDVEGLDRMVGPPEAVAGEIARLTRQYGLEARIAMAATMTTAWLLAQHQPGPTVVPNGDEAR